MPRSTSFTPDQLAERALMTFWELGYNATSMDVLVRATGVSRHGIYTTFGDKHGLFQACFPKYQELVVTPAFAVMEAPDADLGSIATYFDTQISAAEKVGLPGPGCFVANSATEVAPHDTETQVQVAAHNARLHAGFMNVLSNVTRNCQRPREREVLARMCVIFTNGLWSTSRVTSEGADLRQAVDLFLTLLKSKL